MLRFTPIENARQAEHYYSKSDGGYYLDDHDLHREWGGKGVALLGLSGPPDYEQFKRLIHGLDPQTGEQLTAKLIDDRIPGWDVTASVPKGVTTALERGDGRIQRRAVACRQPRRWPIWRRWPPPASGRAGVTKTA